VASGSDSDIFRYSKLGVADAIPDIPHVFFVRISIFANGG